MQVYPSPFKILGFGFKRQGFAFQAGALGKNGSQTPRVKRTSAHWRKHRPKITEGCHWDLLGFGATELSVGSLAFWGICWDICTSRLAPCACPKALSLLKLHREYQQSRLRILRDPANIGPFKTAAASVLPGPQRTECTTWAPHGV